jgi:vacuolar iron transporter family protein
MVELSQEQKAGILKIQEAEITEEAIYRTLSSIAALKADKNRQVLEAIAADELRHYEFWKRFSQKDVSPRQSKVNLYVFLAKVFGLSFSLKLMESGEEKAQAAYGRLVSLDPQVKNVIEDEERHEKEVLDLIDEERLKYTGSIILGLNDALVELTGALSGFTLALGRTKLIAVVGLITGIAAALSMAGSEYLSTKEEGLRSPVKACVYTGVVYILTVLLLILPFFIFKNPFAALATTVLFVAGVIFIFTFYVSVAKGFSFKTRFWEMLGIALGVAALNFLIGLAVKKYFNLDT